MCGRFTLKTDPTAVADHFGVPAAPSLLPRYNVAPTQLVAVVGLKPDGQTRGLALLRWGFVPWWANDPNAGPRSINARAETIDWKPPFNESFRQKRCLIPADGFYEWAVENKKKVPHHFRLRSGGPFAFAGVWDVWKGEGKPTVLSCAVVTVAANEVVRPFHERMPAVLRPADYEAWLDGNTPVPELKALLAPFPAHEMEAVRVGVTVNKVANDGPECLSPAA